MERFPGHTSLPSRPQLADGSLVRPDGRSQPQENVLSPIVETEIRHARKVRSGFIPVAVYELRVSGSATYRIEESDCGRYWLATIYQPSGRQRFRVFNDLEEAFDAGLRWARYHPAP